jgi:hypothetical protein
MPSDLERRRLRATKGHLDQRWTALGVLVSERLDRRPPQAVMIEADYLSAGVWTGLRAVDVERIARNRGDASVVPFAQLPKGLFAWLGYQEVWDQEGGRQPFVFRQAGLTIHVGEIGDPIKPQLIRLEWPGLRDWDSSGVGFQSPGAAHPHWQIDLFESLHSLREPVTFEPEPAEAIEDFGALSQRPGLPDRIASITFERMHLASAAPWWSDRQPEFVLHHVNAPPDETALSRWLGSAIGYLRQELSRCVVRR